MAPMSLASSLPAELIVEEILIRLSVKSAVRFRSVCKLWNSLFYDPKFIQNHFKCSTTRMSQQQEEEDDDDYLLLYKRTCGPTILSCSNLFQSPINKLPYSSFSMKDDEHILLVGSINGLVCIADVKYNQFILWNPAIHWFKKISIPNTCCHNNEEIMPYLYGFGWDPSANDYKLVAKPLNSIADAGAVVYSCKANTWNEHQEVSDLSPHNPLSPCVVLGGIPYWKSMSNRVLKFDVINNEFKFLDITFVRGKYGLIHLNDHVTVVEYDFERGVCVYSVDEQNSSSHIYMIDTTKYTYNRISMSFTYGGEIVFDENVRLYDPSSYRIQNLDGYRCWETYWGHGISYTPTMLALEGMKSLEASRSSQKFDDE